MSFKTLRPLFIVLAALVVIAVIQKRQPKIATLSHQAGLTSLLPASLRTETIQGIDLHHGSNRQVVVRLRRKGTAWFAANYFDAPVQLSRIHHLLRALTHLQGELRSAKAQFLKSFHLESAQANHLLIYTEAFDRPALHLLIGKRQPHHGFLRVEDDARVYSVSSDLFDALGLRTDNIAQPPATKAWLDLQILTIPEHLVTGVELRMPDRRWKFSRPLPVTSQTSHAASIEHRQRQWVLSDPRVDLPLKQGYVDALLSTLRTLRADDITRTDKADKLGLVNPMYEVAVTTRSNDETEHIRTVSIGHEHPQQKGKRYARRGLEGPIYLLPAWAFQRMFPPPKMFLQLPNLQLQPDALRRITLFLPDATVQLEREKRPSSQENVSPSLSDWNLIAPPIDFPLQQRNIDQWIQNLSRLTLETIAPERSLTPDAPPASETHIEMVLDSGVRRVIRTRRVVNQVAESYTLFVNAYSTPFAIDQKTYQQIFPPLTELVTLPLLRQSDADISFLTWQIGERAWRVERFIPELPEQLEEQGFSKLEWTFVNGQEADVDPQQVASVINRIVSLSADDWVEREEPAWQQTEPALLLLLGLRHGHDVQLTIAKSGNSIVAKHRDKPGLFILSGEAYEALQQDLVRLSSPETSYPAAGH